MDKNEQEDPLKLVMSFETGFGNDGEPGIPVIGMMHGLFRNKERADEFRLKLAGLMEEYRVNRLDVSYAHFQGFETG